jgi:hypothetical protein
MNQAPAKSTDWLDSAAVGLSALCLAHCLALPLFAGALPVLVPFVEGHLHVQVLVLVLPLSIVAIGIGVARHRDLRVAWAAAAGMILLIIGATVAHEQMGILADRVFTVGGAIVLAAAHVYNGLLSRRHRLACASR